MFHKKIVFWSFSFLLAALACQIVYTNATSFKEDISLTQQQSVTLQKFKRRMLPRLEHDFMKDDYFLMRFLRVRNFDIRKAEGFLLGHLKWRKEFKMDTVQDEDWSDLKEYVYDVSGLDREGRPVIRWDFGDWDIRKQIVAGKLQRLLRYTFKMFEEAQLKIRDYQLQGKNVTRWVILTNLINVNAVQQVNPTCVPFHLTVAVAYEAQFPGLGDNIYILNTPQLFESVLTLIRPALSAHTRNGIRVYGRNIQQWLPLLTNDIDLDQIPTEYGGTKVAS